MYAYCLSEAHLRRLNGEDARMQQLVSTGDLSEEGAGLSLDLINKSRQELRSELQELESKADAERAQSESRSS